jgi:16S rRNA A1518/A1519 N6-dimethyltransferase RsmA/KsgA/DIM1 with predicted DNA glycosylase/AP lyase activity
MLKNNLSLALSVKQERINEIFLSLNISPKCRAEDLSLNDWLKIFEKLK